MIVKKYELPESRRSILEYLAENRFATSRQLHEELHLSVGKSYTHTLHGLEKLRDADLVKSFEIEQHKIGRNELGWLLTRKGAEAVGREYSTKYNRQPSTDRIRFRDMELELARTVGFAGVEGATWSLIKPITHSPSRPLPTHTEQYHKLVEAVDFSTAGQIWADLLQGGVEPNGQSAAHFIQAQQRFSVPSQVNDYVAWLGVNRAKVLKAPGASVGVTQPSDNNSRPPSVSDLNQWVFRISEVYRSGIGLPIKGTIAVVLILVPLDASPKLWLSRLNDYARLAKYVPVCGVFRDESTRQISEKLLKELAEKEKNKWLISGYGANLKTMTLVGVYNFLEEIATIQSS